MFVGRHHVILGVQTRQTVSLGNAQSVARLCANMTTRCGKTTKVISSALTHVQVLTMESLESGEGMNEVSLEVCDGCVCGQHMEDQAGEFIACGAGKTPYQCKGEQRAVKLSCKLIAYTQPVGESHDPLDVVEQAAAMCYDSKPTTTHKLARGCYRTGHTSVFEHVSFSFEVAGVSRALLAQLTRHRNTAFSVRSQRYCAEDGFRYIEPPGVNSEEFQDAMGHATIAYNALKRLGAANEDARAVLPNACETKLAVSMNARELMHFCHLRLCTRAQKEIRDLAFAMRDEVRKVSPDLAAYLVPQCEAHEPYNFCTEHKSCGRHPTLKEVYNEKYLFDRG